MPIDVGGSKLNAQSELYLNPQLNIVTDGLILYLDPSDPASYPGSGTTWNDLSGNGTNATFQTQPTFIRGNDGAFVFHGAPEYSTTTPAVVENPAINIDLRRDFSIEMWAMPHSTFRFSLFGQGNATVNFEGITAVAEPDRINIVTSEETGSMIGRFRFGFNNVNWVDFEDVFLSRYTWYHFVFTYSHSSPYTKQLYVNGVAKTQFTNVGTQGQYVGTGNLRIGLERSSNAIFWRSGYGKFGQIRIYSKILSESEVENNYNSSAFRYRTFDNGPIIPPTGSGNIPCEYLVVGGGAGGGAHYAAGGGAGGYREGTLNVDIGTNYTVTVGAGGAAGGFSTASRRGGSGSDSIFNTVTSTGGGGGAGRNDSSYAYTALSGGSGGGGGNNRSGPSEGAGNWPFFNPPQGSDGGAGYDGGGNSTGGGGGGAGGKGINGKSNITAPGGPGKYSSITGTSVPRGGGGGGAGSSSTTGAAGGVGGGGNGGSPTGGSGSTNTGGGGGGGRQNSNGGAGGSGIVILKYPSTYIISVGAGLTASTSTVGEFKVTQFTAGTGTISFS